jgi:hypothetical protein
VARRNSVPFKYAEELITSSIHNTENLVFPLRPSRLNERVAIQKGLFLFPRNLSKSFETNLCSTLGFEFDTLSSKNSQKISIKELFKNHQDLPSVLKINLSHKWNNEVIYDLYSMNIDSASLFPGLDGFARSLRFVIKGDRFVPGADSYCMPLTTSTLRNRIPTNIINTLTRTSTLQSDFQRAKPLVE